MSDKKPWEQFANTQPQDTEQKPWERFSGQTKPKEAERSALSDIGNSIASGAAAAGRGILGLSDLVTGSNSIQNLKNMGVDIKSSEQAWKDNLSEKAKQEEQAWNNTQGFVDTLKYGATHPFAVANKVAESLPAMAVSGGMGGAVTKGVLGGAIGEGMQQAGASYADAIEKSQGGTPSDKDALAAFGSGLTTGTISALSGGLAKKLGIGDVDTAIANRVAGEVADSARPVGLGQYAKNIGKGFIAEGALEELPQSATEQMWQNYADDKSIMEGVPEAAAQGLITGGIMGSAFNAANLPTLKNPQSDQNNQDGQGQSSGPMPEVLPPDGSNGLPNNVQPNTIDGAYRDLTPTNAPQLTNEPQPSQPLLPQLPTPQDQQPQTPSEQLGLDPNQGGLSSAAAIAVDTGASPITGQLQQANEQANWLNNFATPSMQGDVPQLDYSPSENKQTPQAPQTQVADLWNSQDPQQRMAILGSIYGNEDMARQNALAAFDKLPKPAQQQITDMAVQNGAVSETVTAQSSNGQAIQAAQQAPLTTLAQDITPSSQANAAPTIEPILGKDGKNKWFATQNKADEFIQKKNLGENYAIEQTGKMRYEIVPKAQPQPEQAAQPNTTPQSKVHEKWLSDFTSQMLQDKQLSNQLSNPSNSDELTFNEFSRKFDENLAKNFTSKADNANEQGLLQNAKDNEIAKQQAYQLAKTQLNQDQQPGKQPKIYGRESYIQTGSERQPTRVAVVEADSLAPDDKNTDNQFRDRTRVASQAQIDNIANNLDPRQLTDSSTMATGAPTLANDGKTIIAGNGRTMAIKQAYAKGKASEYKQSLIEQAQSLGIDPQQIAGMKNPVLVKEFVNPVDVKKMAIESNATGGLAMSAKEQARADSELLPDVSTLASDDKGNINLSRNAPLFRKFISALPVEAQASMFDSDGLLSKEGLARLQNAVLYKAYGDSKAFNDMVESTDVDVKNAINGLTQVAPKIAQAKESIAQGAAYDADISDEITSALAMLQQIRKNEMSVSDYLAQMGLFDDELSPIAKQFIQYLDDKIRSAKAIADLLSTYYDNLDSLGSPNQQDLLGDKPNTDKQSLFNQALEKVKNARQPKQTTADLFAQPATSSAGQSAAGATEQSADQTDNAVEQRPSESEGDGAGTKSEQVKAASQPSKTEIYVDELEKWVANAKSAAEFAQSVTSLRDSQLPNGVNVDFYNFIAKTVGAKSPKTIGFRKLLQDYWQQQNSTETKPTNVREGIAAAKDKKRATITDNKSATNNTGAFDPNNDDIRFSQTGEYTPDLIVTHNLTADAIIHADKIGGLPFASIGITKQDNPLTGFGEVTLIGDKNLIDPKGVNKGKVFGSDIYSPRYPRVVIKTDSKKLAQFNKDLEPARQIIESSQQLSEEDFSGKYNVLNDNLVKLHFLQQNGINIERKYRQVEEKTQGNKDQIDGAKADVKLLERFADAFGVDSVEQYLAQATDSEIYTKVQEIGENTPDAFDAIFKTLADAKVERSPFKTRVRMMMDNIRMSRGKTGNYLIGTLQSMAGVVSGRTQLTEDGVKTKQVFDYSETVSQIDKALKDNNLEQAFNNYIDNVRSDLVVDERLDNGVTSTGARRTVAHTIENVVKKLKKDLRGGESFNYGLPSVRAKVTPQFKTIKAIQDSKDKIITNEQFEPIKKEVDDEMFALAEKLGLQSHLDIGGFLVDVIDNGAKRAFDFFDVKDSIPNRQLVSDFLAKLKDMPTTYFEAKAKEITQFSDFKGAVVPDTISTKARTILEQAGLTLYTYGSKTGIERADAIKQATTELNDSMGDVLFSKSDSLESKLREEVKSLNFMQRQASQGLSQAKIADNRQIIEINRRIDETNAQLRNITGNNNDQTNRAKPNQTAVENIAKTLSDKFGKASIDKLIADGALEIISFAEAKRRNPKTPRQADGYYIDGKAVLIADNLSPDMIIPTFLHELGGHGGLQTLMSDKAYQSLMREFDAMVKRGDKIAVDAKSLADAHSPNAKVAQDEYLPYLISLASRSQGNSKIKSLLNRIVMAVKSFIRDKFGVSMPLTPRDIVALAEKMVSDRANLAANKDIPSAIPKFSKSALKSMSANIKRGRDAMTKALTEKTSVHRAMYRNDIGWVDFVWGDIGKLKANGKKTVGAKGISHIIEARIRKNNMAYDEIASLLTNDIVDTIAKGKTVDIQQTNDEIKLKVDLDDNRVVLLKEKGNNSWMVTAFELSKDETGKVHGKTSPTEHQSYSARTDAGALDNISINLNEQNNKQDDIRYSQLGGYSPQISKLNQALQDFLKNPLSFIKTTVNNKATDHLGKALALLGRRQLVDIYKNDLPDIKLYSDTVEQMDADANEKAAEADKLVKEWAKLKDERPLAELMHDATLKGIDPAEPYQAGDDRALYQQLKRRYDNLSPEAQRVYKQARDDYKAHQRSVFNAIKGRIQRSSMSAPKQAELIKKMEQGFFFGQKVYFPLARFGKYVIVVKDAAGNVINASRAETQAQAESIRKELLRDYPNDKVGRVILDKEFVGSRDGVTRGFMSDLFDAVADLGLTTQQQEEFEDTLGQLYLNSLPDMHFAKSGIHRKGTAGFSQNARRAYAQHMSRGSHYVAKMRHADVLNALLDDMQDYVKQQGENDPNYDQPKMQRVVDEMEKRHDLLMNPKTHPAASFATSLGFIWYMGLSPASAIVNLTQTVLVAYPVMGAKWGFAEAGAQLASLSKDAAANKNDLGAILQGDEKKAFDEAVRRGVIDLTQAHDLAGIAQGEDEKVMWYLHPVMKAASFMFHHAEKFNRQVTFVAAYRLARQSGTDHKAAIEQAIDATYEGHFSYASSNRPRIMQGNWQRVLFLFKQYGQNMTYSLARNAYLSFKGDKQAMKALGGMLALHGTFAGVLGLPLASTLLAVASSLGGGDDEPWDAEIALRNLLAEMFGDTASEVISKGLPRAAGIDLSSRVGLDSLILPRFQEGLEGQREGENILTGLAGPVAGIGVNAVAGMDDIKNGNTLIGVEKMLPKVLKDSVKTFRYATEGIVDKTGIEIMPQESVTTNDIAQQALGFRSANVAQAQEGKSAIYKMDKEIGKTRQRLMDRYARAMMAGDNEQADEVWQEIKRFNAGIGKDYPKLKITKPKLMQSIKQRKRRIAEAENGIYLPSSREASRQYGAFANE